MAANRNSGSSLFDSSPDCRQSPGTHLCNNCPVCEAPVEKAIAYVCDGCSRPVHYSCLGLQQQDKLTCDRLRRYACLVKFLCADCNGIFRVPMYDYFVDSRSSLHSAKDLQTLIHDVVSKECGLLVEKMAALKNEVEVLRSSNIDMIKLLTENITPHSTLNNPVANKKDNICKASDSSTPIAQSCSSEKHLQSYAEKVVAMPQSKVLIKPKNAQKSLQTQMDLLRNINFAQENIGVVTTKRIRDGGIIVGCNNRLDSSKLKDLTSERLQTNYNVSILKSVKPEVSK